MLASVWPKLVLAKVSLAKVGFGQSWFWPKSVSTRAACARSGVLAGRGWALESAVARVCREAGGRVTTNVMIRDSDLTQPGVADARRLKVVADGLPLFGGAQLAVGALRSDGTADGWMLVIERNGPIPSWQDTTAGPAWLCWLSSRRQVVTGAEVLCLPVGESEGKGRDSLDAQTRRAGVVPQVGFQCRCQDCCIDDA